MTVLVNRGRIKSPGDVLCLKCRVAFGRQLYSFDRKIDRETILQDVPAHGIDEGWVATNEIRSEPLDELEILRDVPACEVLRGKAETTVGQFPRALADPINSLLTHCRRNNAAIHREDAIPSTISHHFEKKLLVGRIETPAGKQISWFARAASGGALR